MTNRFLAFTITDEVLASVMNTKLVTPLNQMDDDKANLISPGFSGTPTAPTAPQGDNSTRIATTAFVLANGGWGGIPMVTSDPVDPGLGQMWIREDLL